MAKSLRALPVWLEVLNNLVLIDHSAKDHEPLTTTMGPLNCWVCNSYLWACWEATEEKGTSTVRVVKCVGKRACGTHYLMLPWVTVTRGEVQERHLKRVRCPRCNEAHLNMKLDKLRCCRCKHVWVTGGLPGGRVALLEPEVREMLREFLKI